MAAEEMSTLYDRDFFEWTTEVARLLREGRFAEIDAEHVAEEIEDVGKRDQRGVWGHMRIVIHHLLKWQFQPERRTRSWATSIRTHRLTLLKVLRQSPSLGKHGREALSEMFDEAVGVAMVETGLARECFHRDAPPHVLAAECPFTFEQVIDLDFLPESR